MRLSEVVLGSVIVVGCAGCPGTIEDPAGFSALQQASQREAGVDEDAEVDAGSAEDAAQDPDLDASTPEEAGPSEDASEGWDSAQSDAGDAASVQADASADGGIGCDMPALIMAKCSGDSGCHSAPAVSNGLDLTSPDLAQRLAGRRGTGLCSSYLLIDPETPSQSLLYIKVTPDRCGSRMPLGRTLTDGEQACILRWVESLN